ncbi:transcriptional adapter 1-like isoform X2 [Tubulanus polymorphus]
MLPMQSMNLHNEFLLAILGKCQSLGSVVASKDSHMPAHSIASQRLLKRAKMKRKTGIPKTSYQHRFVPYDPLKHVPQVASKSPEEECGLVFASREMTLPDLSIIHGRMLVAVWENGMDDVQDNAIRLVSLAMENLLKNILTVVLSRRNSYKTRENRFRYAMGCPLPSVFLRNSTLSHDYSMESEETSVTSQGQVIPSIKPSAEVAEIDAITQISSHNKQQCKYPVSLFDVYKGLQVYKSAIPSHTVYTMAMENIISKMWHPSNEDLEQETLYHRERQIRDQKKYDNSCFTNLNQKDKLYNTT